MNPVIGIVIGLIIGAIGAFLIANSSAQRKLQSAQSKLERTEKALAEAEGQVQELQQSPSAIQEIETSHRHRVQEMEKTHQQELEELTQVKAQLEKGIQDTEQSYQTRIQDIEQSYQTRINELEQTYKGKINELELLQDHSPVIEESQNQIQAYQGQIQELQQIHQQEITGLQEDHQTQLREIEQTHQTQLREIESTYQVQILELQQAHEQEIQALQATPSFSPEPTPNTISSTAAIMGVGGAMGVAAGLAGLAALGTQEDVIEDESGSEPFSDEGEIILEADNTEESTQTFSEMSEVETSTDEFFLPETPEIVSEDFASAEFLGEQPDSNLEELSFLSEETDNVGMDLNNLLENESVSPQENSWQPSTLDISSEDFTSAEFLGEQPDSNLEELSFLSEETSNVAMDLNNLLENESVSPQENSWEQSSLEISSEDQQSNLEELVLDLEDTDQMDMDFINMLQPDEHIEALSPELTADTTNESFSDLFEDEESKEDLDFLEMLPTSEETTISIEDFAETVSAKEQDKDPFADLFEPESELTPADPNDPFADFLAEENPPTNDEFLKMLQTDSEAKATDPFSDESTEDWDNLFDDTSNSNGRLEDAFKIGEMVESSKSDTST